MSRQVGITLDIFDVFQILDALESRAIAYEKTAALLNGTDYAPKGDDDSEFFPKDELDKFFMPEECKDAYEAEAIAAHFRDIITALNKQTEKPT